MTSRSQRAPLPWDAGRDAGVDLVRGAAVICMIIAHVQVWARPEASPVRVAITFVNDVASPLFALVMGVSAGIVLTRSTRAVTGTTFVARNAVRGLVLILLGVLLEQLGTFVAIVLMSLGATLLVASPLALLPVPVVAATAAVTFVLGPVVNAAARSALGAHRIHSEVWVDQVLQWFVLSPHYRVVSLLPFVLAGVVLARRGLGEREAKGALVAGLVAAGGLVLLALAGIETTVSGDLPDALADATLALTAFGALVLLARASTPPVLAALEPVLATGALALTAYILHVSLIALVQVGVEQSTAYAQWPVFAGGVFVATVLGCWLWWRVLGRGPVERLMALATRRIS